MRLSGSELSSGLSLLFLSDSNDLCCWCSRFLIRKIFGILTVLRTELSFTYTYTRGTSVAHNSLEEVYAQNPVERTAKSICVHIVRRVIHHHLSLLHVGEHSPRIDDNATISNASSCQS